MKNQITKLSFVALVVACASLSSAALLVDYTAQSRPTTSVIHSEIEPKTDGKSRPSVMSGIAIGATMTLGLLGLFVKPE